MECLIILFLFLILTISNGYNITFRRSNLNERLYSIKSFKIGLSWIIPVVGVIGYFLSYTNSFGENKELREIVIKISDVLVIGGFVGFLSNSSQFFGMFKKELEDIVYSDKFFEGRKNISEIWRKASRVLFNQKFPDISEELFSIIQDYYICKDEYSYYDKYRIVTDIEWADDLKKFIKVKDYINFDLVVEKEGDIEIPFSTWMNGVYGLEKDADYYCNLECEINSENQNVIIEEEYKNNDNEYIIKHIIKLKNDKGKGRFQVSINRERRYIFDLDYDISFRAKYIVKDMTISLNIPEDLNATFICRGTTRDFVKVKNCETSKEYLYKGLILQRQGYTFALHKNTNNPN